VKAWRYLYKTLLSKAIVGRVIVAEGEQLSIGKVSVKKLEGRFPWLSRCYCLPKQKQLTDITQAVHSGFSFYYKQIP
jgi:hypothetical protein